MINFNFHRFVIARDSYFSLSFQGSYYCGECIEGFVGNQTVGCHNLPGLCPDGKQCDGNANCIKPFGLNHYVCEVRESLSTWMPVISNSIIHPLSATIIEE